LNQIPPRFRAATWKSLDHEQFSELVAYRRKLRACVRSGRGVLLSGAPGIGKTWAIAALTDEWQNSKISAGKGTPVFVTAPDFIDNLSEFSEAWDAWRQQSWLDTYTSAAWLVLNDLGKERRNGKYAVQVAERLGRVLRARSERGLLVHITTNLTAKAMKEAYGDSIMSLLSEMTIPMLVNGPDRRMR